ncbi:MAG: 4Fe-4S binding protein [Bacteroidales bacterium]|nr:4Fe-4S binding protein [Bacteroidales bacterium]
MMTTTGNKEILVYTVKNRCRVCYTCVRECPVKAIKIINGQAEVMPERCIACGNCVRVCSQGAKTFNNQINEIRKLLAGDGVVFAAVAPSFPAEFTELDDYQTFVGMLKSLGFSKVFEVAFGADLVAREYKKLKNKPDGKTYISSDCPAVVACIEKHHAHLTSCLTPVVSPMVAMGRVIKKKYGNKNKIVFIGPCIAKKGEASELEFVITFSELRSLFEIEKITAESINSDDFDAPFAGKGSIFPISHGLLSNIEHKVDITDSKVLVANGHRDFIDAITEFEKGNLKGQDLELLCCEGCIMGPGMSKNGSRFSRAKKVTEYTEKKLIRLEISQWDQNIKEFSDLDLTRSFRPNELDLSKPGEEEISCVLLGMGKKELKDQLNCRACGYDTCREHAIAIVNGYAETEMCLPYTIEQMHTTIINLNISSEKLASARLALKQTEKLATMGQLSAGIAHELNNPLGVILMYSNILKEEMAHDESLNSDLNLIAEQAERCKNIVGGLLNFARKNQINPEETNIVAFCKRSIQSVIVPENVNFEVLSDKEVLNVEIDKDQMGQVLTNLEKNAIDAMPDGGKLSLIIHDLMTDFTITVVDEGCGISKENMDKIFTPFYTTKPIGKGTGMGLPLVYGIVKMHRGKIDVESNTDRTKGFVGTRFIIQLPKKTVR